jgi:hypothetical protein
MVTYLLLKERVCQGFRFNALIKPPLRPEFVPTPFPTVTATLTLHLRRRVSAPSFLPQFTLSSKDKKSGHRGRRSSMPNMPLYILQRRIPQPGPVAAPTPHPMKVKSGMFCEGMSSKEHAFTSGQPHDGVTHSSSLFQQGL